jgi:hypothetical protein
MPSQSTEYESPDAAETNLYTLIQAGEVEGLTAEPEADANLPEPARFQTKFIDCMELYADAATVRQYLDAHQGWFRRCAHPMQADPLGTTGYALMIGRFGAFGYEVEPKVGLDLLPETQGIYRITTIPVPDYTPPGYEVDFQAQMNLVEMSAETLKLSHLTTLTRIKWDLDLVVTIQFPRFIYRLPKSLIQTTGDRLLFQIVRQVSRRLTAKVQEDFHQQVGLPLPKSGKRK